MLSPGSSIEGRAPLGYGAAPLGNLYREAEDPEAAVSHALALGIRHFDVAPQYGAGLAEERLGAALASAPSDVVISTKVGVVLDRVEAPGAASTIFKADRPYRTRFDYGHDAVMRSLDESAARLGRMPDIVFVHDLGARTHGAAHASQMQAFFEGGYRALERLRGSGAIQGFGLGVNEWQVCIEAMDRGDFDIVLLAGRYSLLDSSGATLLLPRCQAEGVAVVLGGVFNSGILATGVGGPGPFHYDYREAPAQVIARVAAIEALCRDHGVPLRAAALQFAAAHPAVTSVLAGMGSASEVEDAVDAMRFPIPESFWDRLAGASLLGADAILPPRYSETLPQC